MSLLRIATRRSPLALWQAEHVAARLRAAHPGLEVEMLPMTTTGDRWLESALAQRGGKGLFVKELEQALLDGRADLAVHSMKDLPAELPPGLCLDAILVREDPRDALIGAASLDALPPAARIGTASQRRECQLRERRPDLQVGLLRGNVNSRLDKLAAGAFDAILLAAAGLRRLGFDDRIGGLLSTDDSLPAIGQGALGLECRTDDARTRDQLATLADPDTTTCVLAERALGATLGGSCQLPVAGYAELAGGQLRLRGLLGLPDGSRVVRGELGGAADQARSLGTELGRQLLANGGDAILRQLGVR